MFWPKKNIKNQYFFSIRSNHLRHTTDQVPIPKSLASQIFGQKYKIIFLILLPHFFSDPKFIVDITNSKAVLGASWTLVVPFISVFCHPPSFKNTSLVRKLGLLFWYAFLTTFESDFAVSPRFTPFAIIELFSSSLFLGVLLVRRCGSLSGGAPRSRPPSARCSTPAPGDAPRRGKSDGAGGGTMLADKFALDLYFTWHTGFICDLNCYR